MKTKRTLIPAAIATVVALNMTSTAAEAGYGTDLSRYAHRIDSIAHDLEDEFRIHYKHLGAYRHLRSDIAQVISKAHHIDGLTHDPHASLRHINRDLADLDRLAHHLHDVVDAAEHGRYGGHAHGDTRHVHSLLSSLNGAIHSMQRITERMRHDDRYGHGGYNTCPPPVRGHGASRVSYRSGRGFSFAIERSYRH